MFALHNAINNVIHRHRGRLRKLGRRSFFGNVGSSCGLRGGCLRRRSRILRNSRKKGCEQEQGEESRLENTHKHLLGPSSDLENDVQHRSGVSGLAVLHCRFEANLLRRSDRGIVEAVTEATNDFHDPKPTG